MQVVCARIATTPRVESRRQSYVSTRIANYTPEVSVKHATYVSIITDYATPKKIAVRKI